MSTPMQFNPRAWLEKLMLAGKGVPFIPLETLILMRCKQQEEKSKKRIS